MSSVNLVKQPMHPLNYKLIWYIFYIYQINSHIKLNELYKVFLITTCIVLPGNK